jgi:hypothetical protein
MLVVCRRSVDSLFASIRCTSDYGNRCHSEEGARSVLSGCAIVCAPTEESYAGARSCRLHRFLARGALRVPIKMLQSAPRSWCAKTVLRGASFRMTAIFRTRSFADLGLSRLETGYGSTNGHEQAESRFLSRRQHVGRQTVRCGASFEMTGLGVDSSYWTKTLAMRWANRSRSARLVLASRMMVAFWSSRRYRTALAPMMLPGRLATR